MSSDGCDIDTSCTTYHIYPQKEDYKRITTLVDIEKENPRSRAAKQARREKKEQKESGNVAEVLESAKCEDTFFLHRPYLAFHSPPKVLHSGQDKHADPAILIHGSAFWRRFKLQYGKSLKAPGVVDPRGVVSWKHNEGDKQYLKTNGKKLKGYKVRTWRLWGECGKAYVHQVRADRRAGVKPDVDDLVDPNAREKLYPAEAEGVVYLKWERPFSRHTRRYHFSYSGLDFYWKGTRATDKTTFCGKFVRFNHLKLVASLPVVASSRSAKNEIRLARYTSSVSNKKNGRLEIFDGTVLELFESYVHRQDRKAPEETKEVKIQNLKKTVLYQIIVATALCMITAEKEKREAVGQWVEEAVKGAGG